MKDLIDIIDRGYDSGGTLENAADQARLAEAVEEALSALDAGELRVAEQSGGDWQVNQWLKRRYF